MNETIKAIIIPIMSVICFVLLIPLFILYLIRLFSFLSCAQLLSLVPGSFGIILRRVWYKHTLEKCGSKFTTYFLSCIRTPQTWVGDNVFIGPASWIGLADIGNDVLLASHIIVLSGSQQHGISRIDVPIRKQEGKMTRVTIGKDCWVGSGAIIMADVADHSVVGSGSVVTKKFAAYDIIAGVPAKKIKNRKN